MNFLSRTKFLLAEPGVNPLDEPINQERTGKFRWGAIAIVLFVIALCGSTAWIFIGPKVAASKATPTVMATETPTPTITIQATRYHTATPTDVLYTSTPRLTFTPAATQTPWMITQVVRYPVNVYSTQLIPIYITQIVTQIITATPGPTHTMAATQTPWIITVVVEVTSTPTPTATPTETATPTATPTETATP